MGSDALRWWSVWSGVASFSDDPHRPQKINPDGFSKAHFGQGFISRAPQLPQKPMSGGFSDLQLGQRIFPIPKQADSKYLFIMICRIMLTAVSATGPQGSLNTLQAETVYAFSSSSKAFASLRSAVSKPSVNQP